MYTQNNLEDLVQNLIHQLIQTFHSTLDKFLDILPAFNCASAIGNL